MRAYADSHIGFLRGENQDVCRLTEVSGGILALVLDGMGGTAGGRIAAEVAASTFAEHFAAICEEKKGERAFTPADIRRFFSHAVYHANTAVFERSVTVPDLQGMGTTISAAYLTPGRVYIANIGDSRVYLLRGAEILRLTRDDSYVQEMIDSGNMTEEEARKSNHRNLITRAVGTAPYVDFHFVEHTIQKGDRILLTSDGFTGYYTDEEIAQLACEHTEPKALVKACLAGACARGGADNITAAVMEI